MQSPAPKNIACCYSKEEALQLIQMISSIHKAFDTIIATRSISQTFQNRTNTSFIDKITLWRVLNENATFGGIISRKKIRDFCFGSDMNTTLESGQPHAVIRGIIRQTPGLLVWYCETDKKPLLCQVINPYDDDGRQVQAASLNALGLKTNWQDLTGKKLEHFLRYQKKRFEELKSGDRNISIPVPLAKFKVVELMNENNFQDKNDWMLSNIPDNFWNNINKKSIRKALQKNVSFSTIHSAYWEWMKENGAIKIKDGDGIYKPVQALLNHLRVDRGQQPLLDPNANEWMEGYGTYNLNNIQSPIKIHVLSKAEDSAQFSDFSNLGKEIILDTKEKLDNCVLVVNKGYYSYGDLTNPKIFQRKMPEADVFEDPTMRQAKPIFQTFVRDAYKVLGSKVKQDQVPFKCENPTTNEPNAVGKNPTPFKETVGLICASCIGLTPSTTSNNTWDNRFSQIKQTWDVDHILNLIFNELFDLNNTNNDGRGFLNTCAKCNQQFKSEKVWSPSWDLWSELINKAARNDRTEINRLHIRYPWPGINAPGIVQGNRPPFGGWRVYMTKAYHVGNGPTSMQRRYQGTKAWPSSRQNAEGIDKVRQGVFGGQTGKTRYQAEGINFADRQTDAMRRKKTTEGGMQIRAPQMEGIILNRIRLLLDTELGKDMIEKENEDLTVAEQKYTKDEGMPKGGARVLYERYAELIEIFPIASTFIHNFNKRMNDIRANIPSASQNLADEVAYNVGNYDDDDETTPQPEQFNTLNNIADKWFFYKELIAAGKLGGGGSDEAPDDMTNETLNSYYAKAWAEISKTAKNMSPGSGKTLSPYQKRNRSNQLRSTINQLTTKSTGATSSPFVRGANLFKDAMTSGAWTLPQIVKYVQKEQQKNKDLETIAKEIEPHSDEELIRVEIQRVNVDIAGLKQQQKDLKRKNILLIMQSRFKSGVLDENKKKIKENQIRLSGKEFVKQILTAIMKEIISKAQSRGKRKRSSSVIRDMTKDFMESEQAAKRRPALLGRTNSITGNGSLKPLDTGKKHSGEMIGKAIAAAAAAAAVGSSSNNNSIISVSHQRWQQAVQDTRCELPSEWLKMYHKGMMRGISGWNSTSAKIYALRRLYTSGRFDQYIDLRPESEGFTRATAETEAQKRVFGTVRNLNQINNDRHVWGTMNENDRINPLMVEGMKGDGSNIRHHWTWNIILAALRSLCPYGAWEYEDREFLGIKSTNGNGYEGPEIRIIFEGARGGDTAHWAISIGGQRLRETTETNRGEEGIHRRGGDCGPSAVILAIEQINRWVAEQEHDHDKEMDDMWGGGRRNQTRRKRRRKKKSKRHNRKYHKKTKKKKRRRKKRTRRK